MNNKKEREREELHKTIWKIANELRGSVDGWDFKQYVLGLLFYRFISENIENYVNENQRKAGITDFQYRNISDEEALLGKSQILDEKGFFILPSELFCNIRKGADKNENLNVVISNVFNNIESSARGSASEDDVKGLFDDFTIDNKLGNTVDERNEKLVKLLNAIGDLNFGDYEDNNIDLFGDAYEFLMTMYASSAGKSGGEFFTPQEVGELLARIVIMDKTSVNKVYDPACGSGGLLLKFAKILGKENVREGFFGQEINLTTYNLARINMFLHDINYNKFNIIRDDTLIHPAHWDDEPFDAIVSNPPYSINWPGKSNPLLINDERFLPAGVLAPESYADLAFTMHMLSWLSGDGTAAIVEFPGVLYRPHAEQKIRKYLVDNNFIDSIIQLPSALFFGTPIATCILILKKNKRDTNILFIDASDEFVTNNNRMKNATNKNKLSDENINRIYELYKNRESVENKALLVPYSDIVDNDYNLTIKLYLDNGIVIDEMDIDEINSNIKESLNNQSQIREDLVDKLNHINLMINDKLKTCSFESKKLEDVVNILDNQRRPISKAKRVAGAYPYYGANGIQDYVESYIFDGEFLLLGEDGSVINPDGSPIMNWAKGKIWVNNHAHVLSEKDNSVLLKYVYYYLQTVNISSLVKGIPPKLNQQNLRNINVLIPDKKIQEEIICLLDNYCELEKQLEESLSLELKSRKQQCYFWKREIMNAVLEEVSADE